MLLLLDFAKASRQGSRSDKYHEEEQIRENSGGKINNREGQEHGEAAADGGTNGP